MCEFTLIRQFQIMGQLMKRGDEVYEIPKRLNLPKGG